jgi:hypothetical protein
MRAPCFDRLAVQRVLTQAIRTDNGKEFCCRAMLTLAHARVIIESWYREFNEEWPKKSLAV